MPPPAPGFGQGRPRLLLRHEELMLRLRLDQTRKNGLVHRPQALQNRPHLRLQLAGPLRQRQIRTCRRQLLFFRCRCSFGSGAPLSAFLFSQVPSAPTSARALSAYLPAAQPLDRSWKRRLPAAQPFLSPEIETWLRPPPLLRAEHGFFRGNWRGGSEIAALAPATSR